MSPRRIRWSPRHNARLCRACQEVTALYLDQLKTSADGSVAQGSSVLHTADLNHWSFLLSLTLGYLWAGLRHRVAVGAAPTFQAVGIVPILLGCCCLRGSPYGISPGNSGGRTSVCKEEAPMLERREASCAAAICSNRDQASYVDLAPSR